MLCGFGGRAAALPQYLLLWRAPVSLLVKRICLLISWGPAAVVQYAFPDHTENSNGSTPFYPSISVSCEGCCPRRDVALLLCLVRVCVCVFTFNRSFFQSTSFASGVRADSSSYRLDAQALWSQKVRDRDIHRKHSKKIGARGPARTSDRPAD